MINSRDYEPKDLLDEVPLPDVKNAKSDDVRTVGNFYFNSIFTIYMFSLDFGTIRDFVSELMVKEIR